MGTPHVREHMRHHGRADVAFPDPDSGNSTPLEVRAEGGLLSWACVEMTLDGAQ